MSEFLPHVERLLATAASPKSTKLLFGGFRDADVDTSELHVLRLPQLEALPPVAMPSAVTCLLWLSEERAIAGTKSGTLVLLEVGTSARILSVHQTSSAAITALAYEPNRPMLAAVSEEGTLRLFTVNDDTLSAVATRAFGARQLRAVAFDPRGEWLACGGDSGIAHLLRTSATAAESRDIDVDAGVGALLFTGEGRVVIGCADGSIRLAFIEGAAESENRAKGAQHELAVRALVMGPQLRDAAERLLPRRLFSLGEDGTLKSWDLDSRRRPKTETVGNGAQDMTWMSGTDDTAGSLVVVSKSRRLSAHTLNVEQQVSGKRTFSSRLDQLSENLRGGSQQARLLALDHIGALAEDEARKLIDAALLNDKDEEVRSKAAAKLSARRLSRPALRQALDDKNEYVRNAALESLTALSSETPLSVARAALGSRHTDMRIAALRRMPALCATSPLVPGLVAQRLADADAKVRSAALDALYTIEGDGSTGALRVAFARGAADVRRDALIRTSGAGIAATSAADLLEAALDDEDTNVRETAFEVAVGARAGLCTVLSRTPHFAKKMKALGEAGGQVLMGAGTMSAEEEREPLFAALSARHVDTAVRGAWGLSTLGDPRCGGALLQLSRDPDAGVRRNIILLAQYAIKNAVVGTAQLRGRIEWLLNDNESTVRAAAFDALLFLKGNEPAPAEELEIARIALRGVHQDVRLRALQLLVGFNGEQPYESYFPDADLLLGDALDDEDARVRDEAFRTMWAWFAETPRRALERAALCRHADLRERIVRETNRLKAESWADALLLRFCRDGSGRVGLLAYKQLLEAEANKKRPDVHGAALATASTDVLVHACKHIDAASFATHRGRLLELVDDTRPKVHLAAIECFDRHRPGDETAFTRALGSIFYSLRVRAMELCGRRRDERCIEPARKLLSLPETDFNRPGEELRQRIAGALADVGKLHVSPFFVRLLDDSNPLVREAAARGLATAARPGQEQPLVDALAHEDLPVRSWVAEGLARLGDVRSLPVLAGTLGHDHRPIRLGAIMGFAALGPDGIRGLLTGLDDADHEIQELVFAVIVARDLALAEARMPADLLLSALSSTDPEIRFSAAVFLEARLAGESRSAARELVGPKRPAKAADLERWPTEGEQEALLNVLIRTLGSDDPVQRYASTQVLALRPKPLSFWRELARLRGPSTIGTLRIPHTGWPSEAKQPQKRGWIRALVQGLRSDAPDLELQQLVFGVYAGLVRSTPREGETDTTQRVRRDSLSRLQKLATFVGGSPVLPVLRRGLNDPNHLVRKSAVTALRGLYEDNDPAPLLLMLQSSAADVGKTAVDELIAAASGAQGDASKERAVEALNAPERDVRMHALTRLPTLYDKGSLEPLLAALGSRHSDVRLAVVDRLVGSADPRVAEALGKAMESEHEDLQLKAATLLAQRGDRRTLDVLAGMLRSEREALSSAATNALVQLATSRDVEESQRATLRGEVSGAFVARFVDDPDATANKRGLLRAIAQAGSPVAKDLLVELIEGEDAGLRKAAFDVAESIAAFERPVREKEGIRRKSYDETFFLAIVRVCMESVHADVRQLSVMPLCDVDDPAADGLLAILVDDRSADVRIAAVTALAFRSEHAPGTLAIEALSSVIREGKRELVMRAAEGLATAGRREAFQSTLLVLKAGEQHERRSAVISLGILGDPRGLEELEFFAYPAEELEPDDKDLSPLAVEALARMLPKLADGEQTRIREAVERSARQGGPAERLRAITGLVANGDARSRSCVESIAGDVYDELSVRTHCVKEIGTYPSEASLGVLEEAIADRNYALGNEALTALHRTLPDDETRVSLMALRSPHRAIHDKAADFLAREGAPVAIVEQLKELKDRALRERLRRGLIRRNRQAPGAIPTAAVETLLSNAVGPRADAAWLALESGDVSLGPALKAALEATIAEIRAARSERTPLSAALLEAFRATLSAATHLNVDLAALRDVQYDADVGADATEALFQREHFDINELQAHLSSPRFRERFLAASALAQRAPRQSASFLRELQAPSAAALVPLAKAALNQDADAILGDAKLRALAFPTILRSKHRALVERATAKDKSERLSAIAALGYAGDEEAIAALQSILDDATKKKSGLFGLGKKTEGESDEIRAAAFRALRKAQRRLAQAKRWEVQS